MSEPQPFARDMELVRAILLWAEAGGWDKDEPPGDRARLTHHCRIMIDGDLIEGDAELHRHLYPDLHWKVARLDVRGLTWKGHEFLAAMRDDTMWARVKDTFNKQGVPLVLEVLTSVLKAEISRHTGLNLP